MVRTDSAQSDPVQPTEADTAEKPALTTAEMSDRQLAEAVLARTVRPKVGDIRRLAEAVLAASPKKKVKAPEKKGGGKKAKAKKADRKLAKIPGQKRKKA